MSKIKVLDEQLANQIAAGEVVERPSSVVKELVENAIDAGSTEVDIVIEEGGLTLIRVSDNGGGIDPEDIATAFQRHATSKISTSSDLFRIASLGFRGEALPSIAAVSRLTCISSNTDSGLARKLVIEAGKVTADEPANAPRGTNMSVRDLFYNTPARLKYMKSIQTELGHISDYINRLALAHPGIAFTLKHNSNVLLRTMGTGDRLQVIAAIYGTSAAKAMLPVDGSDADYELTGFLSKPDLTRANRNGITAVVNGRYIRSHAINQSLLQAYHTLLPINRFPLVVLELGMHPGLLDVNVHPSKMEVRFSKEMELRALIERTVKAALGAHRYIPGASTGSSRSKLQYVQDAISFHIADRIGESVQGSASADPAASGAVDAVSLPSARSEAAAASEATVHRGADRTDAHPRIERSSAPLQEESRGSSRFDGAVRSPSGGAAAPDSTSARSEDWSANGKDERRSVQQGGSSAPQGGRSDRSSRVTESLYREQVPRDATERLYAPSGSSSDPREGDWAWREPAQESYGSESNNGGTVEGAGSSRPMPPDSARIDNEPSASDKAGGAIDSSSSIEEGPASTLENADAKSGVSSTDQPPNAGPSFPELHWIGQHHGTYIVAQADDGLYLIDQHAAHERINYEYYLHKFGNPVAASQGLLVPLTLEFTPGDATQLRDMMDLFREAGVEIEPFGAQTFLVRAYPEWMPQGEEQSLIEEMAELLIEERKSINVTKLREKAAIMCACKASIKANDRMTREEGDALLARLSRCLQPYTCPHGRPIIVHLSTYQLEKMFKRVMS
ncbi:DNA mismatch repair endonuclease MutL [Paenibacillus paeoniae]|uniref:DNA mismatch repair protein MutL n=1 Tax=Paenibacillus paeoniae TaxID=2292705 RepID=A0A371PLU0_9BACL|nr:DNA mismatch repair endonuclease MutL [Paenibacillus paeoniae]REK77148.1 DNA mismatch repair endonuclease MutL [Paenibacillus paeoniae]